MSATSGHSKEGIARELGNGASSEPGRAAPHLSAFQPED